MARGRARYQRGRVVATEGGGWEIHYNVYSDRSHNRQTETTSPQSRRGL